jgi:serine/threonine-protein kinase
MMAGSRVGAYEIVAPLGAGGMGEVYRATDTKLGRQVAIKVLPSTLAQDPDRLARFDREARTLATLNHPNIAAIHGLEEADGIKALVMELVEGPTLADRIAMGPLPVDEALAIAKQMAEALEAAHEQGIVHRDLKPANVKVRPDGTVKVLDFGLAKALEPASPGSHAAGSVSLSPTITSPAMTQAGMILGTAAYMSPEQARGKPVDRRADVWAFGCVLFEMLTGQRAFEDEDVSLTLSKVLRAEPDYSALPSDLPPGVRPALRVCLQKDPRRRASDIHDVRLALEGAFQTEAAIAPLAGTPRDRFSRRLSHGLAAAALVLSAVVSYAWWRASRPVDRPLVSLNVDLGSEAARAPRDTFAISPDGTRMVFVGSGRDPGTRQLFIRRIDRLEETPATPLPGTLFGPALAMPFFAPASQGDWIGFFTGNTLSKVPPDGGSAAPIAEIPSGVLGGAWSEDGTIFVGSVGGLLKVPSSGGSLELVLNGPKGFPEVLPGGKTVVFNAGPLVTPDTLDDLTIEAYDVAAGKSRPLGLTGYAPRYLRTSGRTGHLVYVNRGTLYGVAFDPQRVEVRGTPVRLLENIGEDDITRGGGQFATSGAGLFAYLNGRSEIRRYPVLWLDASGKTTPLIAKSDAYVAPRLSPDGSQMAYTMPGAKGADVWVHDLRKGTSKQLTFTGPGTREVAWAPDSRHLVFGDGQALWWIKSDGSTQPHKILDAATNPRPFSFAPGGRLVYAFIGNSSRPDISTVLLDLTDPERPTSGKPEPFLNDAHAEVDPAFSPDGRFLAYASTEANSTDVYVTSFPGRAGKWKVSSTGGKFPVWTTRELFYLGPDDRIMVAKYTITGDSFTFEEPHAWSPTQILRDGVRPAFDISADGTRAAMFPRPPTESDSENLRATFLLNFFDEVRRRVR